VVREGLGRGSLVSVPMASTRRRALRRAAVAGGAITAATVAAVVWLDRRDSGDPWDPEAPRHPEGEATTVTTEDGIQLAVTVAGPPGGGPVVLSHCWTGSRAIWGPVAERLIQAGHRVVLYDQRGHGESTYGEDRPTIALLGHDLRAVLDAVGCERAVLAGHSMGGMSIQSYAQEHPGHFKEHVSAVVLVATAARTLGRELPAALVERLLGDRYPSWAGQGIVGRALVRGSLGAARQRAHVDLTLDGWARTPGYARAGFLTAMASMDLRSALRDVTIPTKVLVGQRDTLTPVRAARQLADGIPGSDLLVLPGAGHMLPLERPDEVVAAIRQVAAAARATAT